MKYNEHIENKKNAMKLCFFPSYVPDRFRYQEPYSLQLVSTAIAV